MGLIITGVVFIVFLFLTFLNLGIFANEFFNDDFEFSGKHLLIHVAFSAVSYLSAIVFIILLLLKLFG